MRIKRLLVISLLYVLCTTTSLLSGTPLLAQSPVAGEPCVHGEQFSAWGVCLHGTIFDADNTPIAGATVTVTVNGRRMTGQSFIHPDNTTPTYALDISVLDPEYLDVMQVTVEYNGHILKRTYIVFPDFNTQNQRLDLHLTGDSDLADARIWGYAIDFARGEAIAGAQVTATLGERSVTVDSQDTANEPLPIYRLTATHLGELNAAEGDTITLAAKLNGTVTQGSVQIGANRQQVNLVLGWECQKEEILPRDGGSFGVPRDGGSFGVPNETCFWGYGLVDGKPTAGMEVRIENGHGELIGQGATQIFGSETDPRFAILVTGADELDSQTITIKGVYKGEVAQVVETVNLAGRNTQQVANLEITGIEVLGAASNDVHSLAVYDNLLWITSSGGGVVTYDTQSGALVDQFLTPHGLGSSIVYNVQRDQAGTFWFGTQAGLSMYQPATKSWTTYTTRSENTPIFNNFIYASTQSDDGILWFAFGTDTSNTGLARYDPQNSASPWTTYPPATFKSRYVGGRIRDMVVDDNGMLWLASEKGLTQFGATQAMTYTHASTDGGLMAGYALAVTVDPAGHIWVGTQTGISRFSPKLTQSAWMTYTKESTNGGVAGNSILDIAADSQGTIWVGTQTGASRYNPQTASWERISNPNTVGEWRHNHVASLWIDSDDAVWFGTLGGSSHYQPVTNQWRAFQATNTVAENRIRAIAPAQHGTVWIGTPTGASSYTNGDWRTFDKEITGGGLPDDYIAAIIAGQDNSIWFGTGGGIGHYFSETQTWDSPFTVASTMGGLAHNKITALALHPDQTLWIGTVSGVSSYHPADGWHTYTATSTGGQLLSDTINSIAVDSQGGAVWIGTTAGLNRYAASAAPGNEWQSFTMASTSSDSGDGLPSNNILRVAVASDGSVWLGTKEAGAVHYQPHSEPKWERFTSATTNGLATDEVGQIAIAEDDAIWFGTKDGVARYTPGGHPAWEQFLPTTVPPNFLTIGHIPSPLVHLAGDEEIWFGTERGISQENILPQRSDLSVDFAMNGPIARDTAVPNVTKHYTLTVANLGQRDAEATLRLALPDKVASVVSDPPADPGSSTTNLTWTLGNQVATPAATPATTPIYIAVTYQEATEANQTLALTAGVDEDKAETFHTNNQATWTTRLLDPYTADIRVALVGSPITTNSAPITFTAWIENIGGLPAENSRLVIQLPPELSTNDDVQHTFGTLRTHETRVLTFTATLNPGTVAGTRLAVSVTATTTTQEADSTNNTARALIPIGSREVETLILVAGQRMADNSRFGISPLLSTLYTLAAHDQVKGTILDLQAPGQTEISNAYLAWETSAGASNLENLQKANAVAEAIQKLLQSQRTRYPHLRYLVFVGSDEIIPFYRVKDSSKTFWEESQYANSVLPPGTVRAALAENYFLTDDFYTDMDPVVPTSQRWPDEGKVLYLPDLASGRLVESATEILAYLELFLATDGQIALNQNIVAADGLLTIDSATEQHDLLIQDTAAVAAPLTDLMLAYQTLQTHRVGGIWQSQHSNHYALGEWKTTDIAAHATGFAHSLLITIGCHAGLSVPGSLGNLADTDIAQSFLAQGGTMIGTSAYAYASRLKASYSEELAIALTKEIVAGTSQSLGAALNRAKHRYYSENAGWIDALDEKVLLPTTLYGLPMIEVTTPQPALIVASDQTFRATIDGIIDGPEQSVYVKVPLNDVIDPTLYQLSDQGNYYEYDGHALVQEGAPIQPSHQIVPATAIDTRTLRGLILRGASYTEKNFMPDVAESFVISAGPMTTQHERTSLLAETEDGWDREFPHSLGYLAENAESRDIASINLVLGAYNVDDGRYRQLTDVDLELLYAEGEDRKGPDFINVTGISSATQSQLIVNLQQDDTMAEVVGLCDNGIDAYIAVDLQRQSSGQWRGICPVKAGRFFLQLVDAAGNVTTTPWQAVEPGAIAQDHAIYIPLIAK